jgi:DNA replicative helicase MCM subunit Mcm2 (Cdc46/Mcm family)
MIIHLDDAHYWNYKGRIKCEKCGTEVQVEIKEGKVISAKKVKQQSHTIRVVQSNSNFKN